MSDHDHHDEPFDFREFARQTVRAHELHVEMVELLDDRVTRIEEASAARWPRSMLLRWRLAREIRASVRGWPGIPRGNFAERRFEWASQTAGTRYLGRRGRGGTPGGAA